MNNSDKYAYRRLLYWGMIQIRGASGFASANPLKVLEVSRALKRSGAIAHWLHNLAMYSSSDFDGFDEDAFWQDYEYFAFKEGHDKDREVRKLFENEKSEFESITN